MKKEEVVSYEKPQLEVYAFAVKVAVGDSQGDIPEDCDTDFDE